MVLYAVVKQRTVPFENYIIHSIV